MNNYMKKAIEQAENALKSGEIPVGAVVVHQGNIIFSAHNTKEKSFDPTAHAEILAIRGASKLLCDWRLNECDLYVTLEPCPMCASAISQARIRRLYFGAYDPDAGGAGSVLNLLSSSTEVYGGICEDECKEILNRFFKTKR